MKKPVLTAEQKLKINKRNFIIVLSVGVILWLLSTVFIVYVVAKGWGQECYNQGVNDGYKLRKAEEIFKPNNQKSL